MNSKFILFAGLLFAYSLVQAEDFQDKQSPIKIGVIIPSSGPRASIGEDAKDGIELAVNDMEASGKLRKNTIQLIFEDSQGDPAKGISAYKKLLADGAKILITQNSNISLPIAPLVTNDQVIQIAIATTADKYSIPNDNTFRACGDTSPEANAMAAFIIERQKENPGNIAILAMEDEYPQTLFTRLQNFFESEKLAIQYQDSFLPKETDFRTIITKLKINKIKHLISLGYQTEIGLLVKQIGELKFHPTTILTNTPVNHREFFDIAKEHANGVYCSYFYINPESEIPKHFKAVYNKPMNWFAANAYDGISLATQALSSCNYNPDIACLKNALYAVKNFHGASGRKAMDDVYGNMQDDVTISISTNGAFVPLNK